MRRKLVDMRVSEFVKEVASSSPAPGGGSASALSCAFGAALSCMVSNLTVGKKKYKDVDDEMREIKKIFEEKMEFFLDAIDKDTEAFNNLSECFSLPKNTEEERKIRKIKIQESLKNAAEVPLKVAEEGVLLMEKVKDIAEKGNKNAISDAGVSALMMYSGVQGALLNVKINAISIKDEQYREELLKTCEVIEKNSCEILVSILEIVKERM